MKYLLIGLATLLLAPSAMAGEAGSNPAVAEQTAASSEVAGKASVMRPVKKRPRASVRGYPAGDLRHCLELKGNAEIIKCSERSRGR